MDALAAMRGAIADAFCGLPMVREAVRAGRAALDSEDPESTRDALSLLVTMLDREREDDAA